MPRKKKGPEQTPVKDEIGALPTLVVPDSPGISTRIQLRYLETRTREGRQLAEVTGAEQFVDYAAAALAAEKAASEVAETTKRALASKAATIYFAQEGAGRPFDGIQWRGHKTPLGIEVGFTAQSKHLPDDIAARAREVLGSLWNAFAERVAKVELSGPLAAWLLAAFKLGKETPEDRVTVDGPIALRLLDGVPELRGREDAKIDERWRLRSNFDEERRRRFAEMTEEQREMCRALRNAGFATPRVGLAKS